ncbi:hypothetical protein CSPX01_00224, partial [Colletotrichum filicis]
APRQQVQTAHLDEQIQLFPLIVGRKTPTVGSILLKILLAHHPQASPRKRSRAHHDFRQRSLPPCDFPWLRRHGSHYLLPLCRSQQ